MANEGKTLRKVKFQHDSENVKVNSGPGSEHGYEEELGDDDGSN